MLKTIMLAGSVAVIALTATPIHAQTTIIEKRTIDVEPERKVIIRERTGSVDDEDCVKTKSTRTDVVTGDKEVRVKKECD